MKKVTIVSTGIMALLLMSCPTLFADDSSFGLNDSDVAQVSAGGWHSMIVKTDGTLWAVGDNSQGQLGDGTTNNKSVPVKVMTGVAQVSAGEYHTMIVKTDGTLWAVGTNRYGELGDGTSGSGTYKLTPVQVMTHVARVSAGGEHSMIVKKDGTLWAVGRNREGQLGDGTSGSGTYKSAPVLVMTNVAQVSAGGKHSMIVKKDGTLWAVGRNREGQLGDGTTTDKPDPVKVMTDVARVSSGYNHTMILKTDGTLWAVGFNRYYGQPGNGTSGSGTDKLTPVRVMTHVAQVSSGEQRTMILKTDGTLWAVGFNRHGSLGDGTTTEQLTPVRVMTHVAQVSAGEHHTMIVKTDGTLWAVGCNRFGQLGDGRNTNMSTPVEITGVQ